ncbi:MAG: PilZ domain-containing protein [Desulfobacterales bacterium]
MVIANRRHSPRQYEEATIQILFPPDDSTVFKDSDSIPVKMYNQSENGLYIEMDRALQPGSTFSFKMVDPEREHPENAYFIYDGQVIWCKKIDERTSRFGIGIKILSKAVQAEVLTSRLDRPV